MDDKARVIWTLIVFLITFIGLIITLKANQRPKSLSSMIKEEEG